MTSITIARQIGSSTFTVVADPSVPRQQQLESFKALCRERRHPKFDEVRLVDIDLAPTKRVRFNAASIPASAPKPKATKVTPTK